MTLLETVTTLKRIALSQPNIKSAGEGSIYDFMNSNPSVRYSVFFITQTAHRQDENFDYYGFTLFYVDRLVDDLDSNRLQIQSVGKDCLHNIILTFCESQDAGYTTITYQPFTENTFVDLCAGIYATVELAIPLDAICEEIY